MVARSVSYNVKRMYDIIKANQGPMDHVDLVIKMNKSPSTVEKMRPFLLRLFPDASYEKGFYNVKKSERFD